MEYPKARITHKYKPEKGITEIEIDESQLVDVVNISKERPFSTLICKVGDNTGDIQIRGEREFKRKGLFLSKSYDWVIVTDSEGSQVLLPLKKKDC